MSRKAFTRMSLNGKSYVVYLERPLVLDTTFPFTPDDELTVEIIGKSLVVTKAKEETL